MDSELHVSFTTRFRCQKDVSMSNVFLFTAYKVKPSKFGSCNLKFSLVTINLVLKVESQKAKVKN